MGEVYRAHDTRLNRDVALKVLPELFARDAERMARFRREAQVLASLNHPNIATIHGLEESNGNCALVMELVEGPTLAERIAGATVGAGLAPPSGVRTPTGAHTTPATPFDEALPIAKQMAEGLEYAHEHGIIHRDLKPANVKVRPDGTVKILDFGLAKALEQTPAASSFSDSPTISAAASREGMILGTAAYMSPEQARGKTLDRRCDIWSFGAALFEMLSGKQAFAGEDVSHTLAAVIMKEPDWEALPATTPPSIQRLVRRCLNKDPKQRLRDIGDARIVIEETLAGGTGVPPPVAVGPSGARPRTAREYIAWATAAVAILAVLLLAIAYSRRELPQPAQVMRLSLLPPPKFSFAPYNFAVSPDGARLGFVAVGPDGKDTLWVRTLSAASAQQLNGTEWAAFPFWSPDNRRIGFFADGKLKTVDIAGGAVEILCQAPVGNGGTWNRDGTIVFAPTIARPLYRVPASGGVPTPVTNLGRQGSGQAHRWPFFLPDGKHFLYFVDSSAPEDKQGNGIYVGSLDSGEPGLISSVLSGTVVYASGNLLYVRDRSLMAQPFSVDRLETTGPPVPIAQQELEKAISFWQSGFSVSQNGVLVFQSAADTPSRLVWFDSSGKELEELPEGGYRDPALSPDGRFLAVASDDEHNGRYYVRVYDLARGISTRLSDTVILQTLIWSRDGKRITYTTVSGDAEPAGQRGTIEEIASDGSGPAQVLLKGANLFANDWTPDGHLVFMDFAKGLPHLAVYSASDRQVAQLAGWAGDAQCSPDGKWVTYALGSVGGGTIDIFIQPFPGPGRRVQISNAGGAQPRWSRDGRQVFYIQPDRKLMAVSFDPKKGAASAPRVLFQTRIIAPGYCAFQYDVSPDGRFLINSFPSNSSSPLTVLTGWTTLVKGP
jgi:serine/threonine protein kinase/Tol biopolymer transport system component